MKQATGNIWDTPADAHVITTNGIVKQNGACVMGRGIAKEARDKFPGIDLRLGSYLVSYGNRPFQLGIWHEGLNPYRIVSMPTKAHWAHKANLDLIITSAHLLMEMADKFHWDEIVMPRPGCGNGQLQWQDVEFLLANVLDDRFTTMTWAEA